MNARLTLRIWFTETGYELRRVTRTPAFFVPTLLLPQLFFLLFAVLLGKQNGGAHGANTMLVGYSAFGMLAAALMGVASSVAVERERGIDQLKRALPMPPGAYLGAKVMTAMVITAVMTMIMMLIAVVTGSVSLAWWQWPALLAINILGVLPFAALGLFIGGQVSGSAAPGIANLVYLPMSFLSGLWIPLQFLPVAVRNFAPLLPAFHFVQLPLAVIGAGNGSPFLHILVLVAFAGFFFWLARRGLVGRTSSSTKTKKPAWRRLATAAGIALCITFLIKALAHHEAASAQTTEKIESNSFAIRDVRVFDGMRTIEHANAVVMDGRIAAVGADVRIPDGISVTDGRGHTVMPGLIDAHTHTWSTALQEALRFGVTTELDMFSDWHPLAAAKIQRTSYDRTASADLWSAGTLVTAKGGHGTEYGFPIPTLDRADDATAFVDARIAEGSDYIKLILDDGSAYGPKVHIPSLTPEVRRAVLAAARKAGKLSVAHVAKQSDARLAFEDGLDGLAHIFVDEPADADFIRLIREHHGFVTATLSVYASSSGSPEASELVADPKIKPWLDLGQITSLKAAFPSRHESFLPTAIDNVRRLHEAGVPILAGTDAPNPGTAHGASLHEELALLVRSGLTPTEALEAATSVPAKIFGLQDRGWIVAGLRADLVMVDGDPTTDIKATRAIVGIWKNGYAVDRRLPVEKISMTKARPAPDDPIIADFEGPSVSARHGQWHGTTDQLADGKSTVELALATPGAGDSHGALRVHGEIRPGFTWPWAGALFTPAADDQQTVDYSSRKTLSFRVCGDGRRYNLMMFNGPAAQGPPQDIKPFETGPEWSEIHMPLAAFTASDLGHVRGIAFAAGQPLGAFDLKIDDVEIR